MYCLAQRLRERAHGIPLLLVGCDDPDEISRFLALGVADYVSPPLTRAALLPRLLRLGGPPQQVPQADQPVEVEGIVGSGPAFRELIQQIETLARCDATVLIEGETGTGKELCARAIHRLSTRNRRTFCAVNCGAIPRDLVENELFGHRKAAFTGAFASQVGLIGESEGGTLLFDEVDCLAPGAQATLLRFVQSQEYRPLGASRVHKADVRVLAATNTDLSERARQGEFREDLYYRLDLLRLRVPPLRERREDVPLLAKHFLVQFAEKFQACGRALSEAAIEALVAHDWPGNVRELEHVIGRSVAYAFREETIQPSHLQISRSGDGGPITLPLQQAKTRVVEEFERGYISTCLAVHEGNIAHAARAAGKNRRAFWELMRKYSIGAEPFRPKPS